MLIPLMRFVLYSLILSSFLVLLRNSFYNFFFHLDLFDGIRFQYSQVLVSFFFRRVFWFFLDSVVVFLPSLAVYRFSLLACTFFSRQPQLVVFHWRLSDNKSPQISMILLGILAVVSILPLISSSSSFFQAFNYRSKCTNYNWYYRHRYVLQFFSSLVSSKYLFVFSLSFDFTL